VLDDDEGAGGAEAGSTLGNSKKNVAPPHSLPRCPMLPP